MDAGKLRHRVIPERQVTSLDSDDGIQTVEWLPAFTETVQAISAGIQPMSGREILTANQINSKVTHRIIVRKGRDFTASMRLRRPSGGPTYNIEAVIPDANNGEQYLTLLCSTGVNDG